MSGVRVITDSTSYLPRQMVASADVIVVPVQVIVAGQAFDETQDEQAQRVADALRDWLPVTTSRPTPERFAQAIEQARDDGATGIVLATLSASMSATFESAQIAAKECDLPVEVVDSQTIAMALGFAVLDGARIAAEGGDVRRVAETIRETAARSRTYFYVDTMEYLRRGGRVSAARAAVGHALKVKPLLTVEDGSVALLEKVRTASRALTRMADLADEAAQAVTRPRFAVQHLSAADRALALADRLRQGFPGTEIIECPVGGVVGAHVGPGMVSVVIAPGAAE
jgi:DegV family protein with EDD domain